MHPPESATTTTTTTATTTTTSSTNNNNTTSNVWNVSCSKSSSSSSLRSSLSQHFFWMKHRRRRLSYRMVLKVQQDVQSQQQTSSSLQLKYHQDDDCCNDNNNNNNSNEYHDCNDISNNNCKFCDNAQILLYYKFNNNRSNSKHQYKQQRQGKKQKHSWTSQFLSFSNENKENDIDNDEMIVAEEEEEEEEEDAFDSSNNDDNDNNSVALYDESSLHSTSTNRSSSSSSSSSVSTTSNYSSDDDDDGDDDDGDTSCILHHENKENDSATSHDNAGSNDKIKNNDDDNQQKDIIDGIDGIDIDDDDDEWTEFQSFHLNDIETEEWATTTTTSNTKKKSKQTVTTKTWIVTFLVKHQHHHLLHHFGGGGSGGDGNNEYRRVRQEISFESIPEAERFSKELQKLHLHQQQHNKSVSEHDQNDIQQQNEQQQHQSEGTNINTNDQNDDNTNDDDETVTVTSSTANSLSFPKKLRQVFTDKIFPFKNEKYDDDNYNNDDNNNSNSNININNNNSITKKEEEEEVLQSLPSPPPPESFSLSWSSFPFASQIPSIITTNIHPTTEISLLIEIVSATNLPIPRRKSTIDPYVIVFMGKEEQNHNNSRGRKKLVHKTKYLRNSTNPIWAVNNGSLFLLSILAKDFVLATIGEQGAEQQQQGLTFIIKDHDLVTADETIAKVTIPAMTLLEQFYCNSRNASTSTTQQQTTTITNSEKEGVRMSYDLEIISGSATKTPTTNTADTTTTNGGFSERPPPHHHHLRHRNIQNQKQSMEYFKPKLNLRIRKSTPEDKMFIKQLEQLQLRRLHHQQRRSNNILHNKKNDSFDSNNTNTSNTTTPTNCISNNQRRNNNRKKHSYHRILQGVNSEASYIGPRPDKVHRFKREKKIVDGVRKYRVKPYPDPSREEHATKWMSSKELDDEAWKPTKQWVRAGSTGKLGKVYLEVIRCDNLPRMDVTQFGGSTDAFCCIIYEDAIVNTNVINDERSPRWMPWTQRAFIFTMAHPSSQVLLGVLDYDAENGINKHDPIGRISIDITNFRSNTEYILTYDLYRTVLNDSRKSHGTITVRLRIEYNNNNSYRDFIMESLFAAIPSDWNYIHLPRRNDFLTSYFVCNGEENLQRFSMSALMSYKNELVEYMDVLYYISQAAITVLLWRGHFRISQQYPLFRLPLHSMIAFTMGITAVENYNLIPSYVLFSIVWLLLATNEQRQRNPSPWKAMPMTFGQMWHGILFNKTNPVDISNSENEAAIREWEEKIRKRKEREREKADKAAENAKKIGKFLGVETDGNGAVMSNEEGDGILAEDLTSKKGGGIIPFRPLANMILLPIQKILGQICKVLRIVSSIVMWDDSIYTFFLVNVCLLTGILFLFVPWSSFIRWILRIIVWVLLGPWMKLLDIYYVKQQEQESDTEAFQRLLEMKAKQVAATREAVMLQKEKIIKTRAMKTYMFGKYITRVPQFKDYRFPDYPRMESSSAKPLPQRKEEKCGSGNSAVVISKVLHGQTFLGDMIPTRADIDANKNGAI